MTCSTTTLEAEIRSTPAILRQTIMRVAMHRDAFAPYVRGPLVLLGCGSSYCLAVAGAALHEMTYPDGEAAQGCIASEYLARPHWSHLAISRTGQTTELVEAMGRARAAGGHVALLCGAIDSPAAQQADVVLPLELAAEQGIIQTRFITAAALALRLLIGGDAERRSVADLPERVERGLAAVEPDLLNRFERVVFLGRGWRYGLALAAALNLQETALAVPESHQTLEYRHGPIATAGEGTLVWCFDALDDAISMAVLDHVQQTGATVRCTGDDPLVTLAQAQLLAMHVAISRGVHPDSPRHLSRAIVWPTA